MKIEFSEDVNPLTKLKVNPRRGVKQVVPDRRPALLTSRRRGAAVMQSLDDFEAAEEDRAFIWAVVAGLNDLEAGRELSLDAAKTRMG